MTCPGCDEDKLEHNITEIYGTIKIGCCEFDSGRILRELDPIAFRCAMSEYECECDKPEPEEDNQKEGII